jgi:UDP-2,4-diacetamido-2,4,6-trideoxy-beta-L-altropyranose hydrolase
LKSNRKPRLVLRADGNSNIGLGHIVRLLSIADLCKESFECLFLTIESGPAISELIKHYCPLIIVPLDNEKEFLASTLTPSDLVILDGYHYDENYQTIIRSITHKLVMIDDIADRHLLADVVINHGGEQLRKKYSVEPYCELLLGFQWLMLREPFLNAAKNSRWIDKVDSIFICMGGADPFNITVKVLQAALASAFIKKVVVVTGSAFTNMQQLDTIILNGREKKKIIHEQNIDAQRMVMLVQECQVAICPSSSIALEICCVKAGLITGTFVENQEAIHHQMIRSGCCISIGDFKVATVETFVESLNNMKSLETINAIMEKQGEAIDGLSGERILHRMKKLGA